MCINFTIFLEILEAANSTPPLPVIAPNFTTAQLFSTTVSQQFTRSTSVSHTSNVSSVNSETITVKSIKPEPRGMLLYTMH